jgi:hypothetical protein
MEASDVDLEQVLYVDENVLVAEFPADMPLLDEVFAAVNERFESLAEQSQVDTHVSVLNVESALNSDVFGRAQEAAEAGKAFGITNWIIVSEDIKSLALSGKVRDIEGVATMKAETMEEAFELAGR